MARRAAATARVQYHLNSMGFRSFAHQLDAEGRAEADHTEATLEEYLLGLRRPSGNHRLRSLCAARPPGSAPIIGPRLPTDAGWSQPSDGEARESSPYGRLTGEYDGARRDYLFPRLDLHEAHRAALSHAQIADEPRLFRRGSFVGDGFQIWPVMAVGRWQFR
jgi:hypothetical protein